MPQDIVRVLRLIEYEGPRELVEQQLKKSLHGTRTGVQSKEHPEGVRITAVTLDTFPQILEDARRVPCPVSIKKLTDDLTWTRNELFTARTIIQDLKD